MRVLLAADLHYSLKQFDWVVSVAGDFDVVVLAGDHLDLAGMADREAQIVVVLKYLARVHGRTRLLVSSGNHDLTRTDERGEKTAPWLAKVRRLGIPVDGEALEIDGTTFTICPYWDGPQGEAAVGAQLARAAAVPKQRWVWVYHAPPDEARVSWVGKRHLGDTALLGWIRQYRPDMVLTGHIHESPFRRGGSWVDKLGPTWVFNAGRQIGPCPTHVIVDTDARRAEWFSLAGNQEVGLDEARAEPRPDLPL